MPLAINQIKAGLGIEMNGEIFLVTEHQHVKPGKGGAFAKVRLRNVRTNQVFERTIKPADKVEEIPLEERRLQYLYDGGDVVNFMDNTTFEEVPVSKDMLGNNLSFLLDNLEVRGLFHGKDLLNIELPIFIEAEITHTEPGFRGDTSKAGNKPATIEPGATIQVPLFIEIGDKVKIDTRTGTYVERVKS